MIQNNLIANDFNKNLIFSSNCWYKTLILKGNYKLFRLQTFLALRESAIKFTIENFICHSSVSHIDSKRYPKVHSGKKVFWQQVFGYFKIFKAIDVLKVEKLWWKLNKNRFKVTVLSGQTSFLSKLFKSILQSFTFLLWSNIKQPVSVSSHISM